MHQAWLRLFSLKGISVVQKRMLVRRFGGIAALFNDQIPVPPPPTDDEAEFEFSDQSQEIQASSLPPRVLNGLVEKVRASPSSDARQWSETLETIGAGFIGFDNPDFPDALNRISDPPLGLFYIGRVELLKSHQLAIIGSRNPSPSGRKTTMAFARELGTFGFTITSGMACGIDSDAHNGCLSGSGYTIAVVGTGLDIVYPRSNQALFRSICESGLVVSEYPPGTPARKAHFPQRNRLISGLSLGTLVVEAGLRSGSLITARLAAEQGKEVFAIPGSIHVPTSRGCHYLIRQGAKLVESLTDIIEEFGQYDLAPAFSSANRTLPESNPELPQSSLIPEAFRENEDHLLALIDHAPVSLDELIERSGLTLEEISSILMDLELRGLVADTANGYQRLPDTRGL